MDKICGIYKITNQLNNKPYIGQSIDIARRWSEHKSRAFEKNANCYYNPLYCAIRKYGINNFKFEVIEECLVEDLNEREKYYIKSFNSQIPYGYNIKTEDNKKSQIRYCSNCGARIDIHGKLGLCPSCYYKSIRVTERPTKEELYNLLCENTFVALGKKYNVSDNAIRKWCRQYNIPDKASYYRKIKK